MKPYYREIKGREFTVLDVGCGNHSVQIFKKWFPQCHYHGLDKGTYNNDPGDFSLMDRFFNVDLSSSDLAELPDNKYDVIACNHVIEHLHDGGGILANLVPKLRSGGRMYVEFPGKRSLSLPSAEGTLNFHDDPSHITVYSSEEIAHILAGKGMTVIRAGTRRDLLRLVLFPLSILYNTYRFIRFGKITSKGLWYVLGFAEFVYAVKK